MALFRSGPSGSGSAPVSVPVSVPGIAGSDRRYKPLTVPIPEPVPRRGLCLVRYPALLGTPG